MQRERPAAPDGGGHRREVLAAGAVRWLRKWGWPLALVTGVLAFFGPVLVGGRVFFLKDAQLLFYPGRMALRERLLAGDLPEWLPTLDLGMPFLASLDSGVLYPLNVLLLLPAPWSVGCFVVVHAALAALGAFMLARRLGTSASAAAFGAVAVALGGYLVSLTWGTYYMMSLAWLPLVGTLALRTLRHARLGDGALLGLALGAQILCGEPQGVVLTLWFMAAMAIAMPGGWRRRRRGMLSLAVGIAIAGCIAMPQILPTLEYLPRTRRAGGLDLLQAQHWSLHPLRGLELLVPWIFGSPLHFDRYLGYFMEDEGGAFHRDPWLVTPYLGGTSLLFALVAATAPRRRHRWWVRACAVLTVLALVLAWGRHTPVFAAYFHWVPGANLFRYPAKLFGLVAVTLPLLAAAGLDAWRAERAARRPFIAFLLVALVGVLVALPLAGAIGASLAVLRPAVPGSDAAATVRAALVGALLVLGVSGGTLVLARWRGVRRLGALAVVLLAVDLAWNNSAAYETASPEIYAAPDLARRLVARTPAGEVARLWHGAPTIDAPGFDALPGPRRADLTNQMLHRNVGILHGLDYTHGYTAAGEATRRELWERALPWRRRVLDVVGTRFLLLPSSAAVGSDPSLLPLSSEPDLGVVAYENRNALPFAFSASAGVPVASASEALRALRLDAVGAGAWVAVEEPSLAPVAPDAPAERGPCLLLARPDDAIRLDCVLTRPGFVVVNASHHPNWTARIDGAPTEIRRANAFVMAVRAPSGRHRVELEYREPSLPIGLGGALVGLVGAGLLLRRGRRAGPEGGGR